METTPISNYKDLKLTIIALRAKKQSQEAELKITIREFMKEFDHMAMIRSYLSEIAENKEVRSDLLKIGLHVGTNLVIKVVTNQFFRAKTFLSQLFGQRFSNVLSNFSLPAIGAEIISLVSRNAQKQHEVIDYESNGGLQLKDTLADEER